MDEGDSAPRAPSANSHSWGLFVPNSVPVAPGSVGEGPSWQAGVVSPFSLPCSLFFLQPFGSALLWARAVPAAPGAGLWLGRAGGPTAPGPPVPSQNQPGLRHSFSSGFPAGRAPKATTAGAGSGPSQTRSCRWCWQGPVPAVPLSPPVLGTVWGQLMVSAWDGASSARPGGLFPPWWLSRGRGMTQGSWGLREPRGASPEPGVGAPGDSGARAGPRSWRISPGPPCPAGTLRRRRGLSGAVEANSSLEFPHRGAATALRWGRLWRLWGAQENPLTPPG